MNSSIFVDTGGHYAMLNPRDQWHAKAHEVLAARRTEATRFVTTDYVLQETATLLRVRGQTHLVEPWLEDVFRSNRCRIEWTTPERFHHVRRFFAKHDDKQWSFTDCTSFCVMRELGIHQALASDSHFEQAGFERLLSD